MEDMIARLVKRRVALRIDGSSDPIIGIVDEVLDGVVDIRPDGVDILHRVALDRIAVVTVLPSEWNPS